VEGDDLVAEINIPSTVAYLGDRLATRRKANAREMEQEKVKRKVKTLVITRANFMEASDIHHCYRLQFNEDEVLPTKNVTRFQPFPNEDRLHRSHPRTQQKLELKRMVPKYKDYEEPWVGVEGAHVVRWE